MNEAGPKAMLVRQMRRDLVGSVVQRHEDIFQSGKPDVSVAWNKFDTWLEVKHVTPEKPFHSKAIQKLTCLQLASASRCWYVVYEENGNGRRTGIIHPKEVFRGELIGEWATGDFDHQFVIDFIRRAHS